MLVARVESVNVGVPRSLVVRGAVVSSGIFKVPRAGPQHIDVDGLAGDSRVEPPRYGGAHHAVHVYPLEHYAYWERRYGRSPYALGTFGENLTVRGATESDVRIGDVVRCGTARLEITHPRIPCRKLTARMEIAGFATAFLESLRVGYYLRVFEAGVVQAGDAFDVVDRSETSPTVQELTRVSQLEYWDAAGLAALLGARGLPPGWIDMLEDKLARARRAAEQGSWFGTRTLRVSARDEAGTEAVHLSLECARGRELPRSRAGQVMTLVVAAGERRGLRRSFALAEDSVGPVPARYRVVIPRAASDAEPFLALEVGDAVRCTAPHGTNPRGAQT